MNHEATHYDRDCLKRLLDDSLPEPLANEAAEHVATCADCRQQLESLAGDPQWWSEACSGVKEILADPTAYWSSTGDIRSVAEALSASSSSAGSGDSFATDFAVDFLEPTEDRALLGRLGDYEILEVIGRGGMGIVLKGFQRELNRYVAVKVLSPHLAQSAAARKRFAREAQATAAIVHPHVMAIHAVAATARLPYLVMPFVACESLQDRLDRHGPLDVKDVLRIGLQAANGLAAAHAQGLVHRDVKPANILLETSVDRVMLTDFGLARAVDDATLTRTGIIAGTPQYMSPEQAGGDAVDHRSDLFSLGSVLYAMCTGRPPFRAETTFGVLRRIRETAPRAIREINADIPEWLERIVLKLLSKDAGDRLATATETAILLENCLAHVQQPTTVKLPDGVRDWRLLPEPVVAPVAAPPTRSRVLASSRARYAALCAIVCAATGAGAYLWTAWRDTVDERAANARRETASDADSESASGGVPYDSLLNWDETQTEIDTVSSLLDSAAEDSTRELESLSTDFDPSTDSFRREDP
jgi:serine/threonine-protein kinase